MMINIDFRLDPMDITKNCQNDEIKDFIIELDKQLENEDFTVDLIKELLDSLGMNEKTINEVEKMIEGIDV